MLGEKIQQLRKEKGLSQEQLAAQLTISRQAISKWELGESMPDTDNIIQLSKLFSVSTDYLLNDECADKTISTTIPTKNEMDSSNSKGQETGSQTQKSLANTKRTKKRIVVLSIIHLATALIFIIAAIIGQI